MTPTPQKIFISWSGAETKLIANTWAALLRHMFDFVEPFVSTAINPGERGLDQIKEALADTQFGIFVTTRANQHAAWLNFEAGAISNQASDTTAAIGKVAPCLVDFVADTDLTSPLRQFQYRTLNREGVVDILTTIAEANGVDASRVTERFDLAWDAPNTGYATRFENAIAAVAAAEETSSANTSATVAPDSGSRPAEDMFSEILAILRDLQRREASDSAQGRGRIVRRFPSPEVVVTADGTQLVHTLTGEVVVGPAPGRRLDPKSESRLARDIATVLKIYAGDNRTVGGFSGSQFGYRVSDGGQLQVAVRLPSLSSTGLKKLDKLFAVASEEAGWESIEFFPPPADLDARWHRLTVSIAE